LTPSTHRTATTSISDTVQKVLLRIAQEQHLTPALRARFFDIAGGLSYREIALQNDISINTVKTEIRNLLRGLGVRCRHEIESAVEAAEARVAEGASEGHTHLFLRLRWE